MRVELRDLDSLEDIVGAECYEQALRYVRDDAITQQVWVEAQNALCGVVRGRHGEFYTPAVYFRGTAGSGLEVASAQCSCTARYGCEHAAALLMSGTEYPVYGHATAPEPEPEPELDTRAAWERQLESLLQPGEATGKATAKARGSPTPRSESS